jgi:hypothetical protein
MRLSRLHETIIVTHHQVTFHLLQRIKTNTNDDQQTCPTEKLCKTLCNIDKLCQKCREDGYDRK